MLSLQALQDAELHRQPYEWAYVVDAFESEAAAAALRASFPPEDFWHIAGEDHEKRSDYAARPLVTLGADRPAKLSPLAAPWRELVSDLLSPAYRGALGALTGRDLEGALMEASVWRWSRDAQLGPHRDLPDKILTHVMYLGAGWEPAWGGCLRILGSSAESDLVAELPPDLGTASVLIRGDRSWHSVTPVTARAAEPRRSIIVTWFVPGSVSPVWATDEQGDVRCTAGGIREDAGPLERVLQRGVRIARRAARR